MWCIPKQQSHPFVAGMERVLKVIPAAVRPAASGGVHGRDEQAARGGSPREVTGTPRVAGEVRRPLPPPGRMHVWMFGDPLSGWRRVAVTKRRTTLDWAKQVRALANLPRYRDVESITLVCDNLDTHSGDSFYAAFPVAEASRLNDRIHLVHTPKHGSWLNVVGLCQESSAISSGSGDPPIWAGLRSARNFRASHAASRHASDSGSEARTTPIRP